MAAGAIRDASDAGTHCSVCSALDFLPFKCAKCNLCFCKQHASQAAPDAHECLGAPSAAAAQPSTANYASFQSFLPDRSRPPDAGPSEKELAAQGKKQAALDLLHKNFPNTASVSSSKMVQPPKPANSKVALMKLKQKAKPADPRRNASNVLLKDRRFFTVVDASSGKVAEVWLPVDTTGGKALDLLADYLGVSNRNNLATTPETDKIHLRKLGVDLLNAVSLGSQIADGDEISIVRGIPA